MRHNVLIIALNTFIPHDLKPLPASAPYLCYSKKERLTLLSSISQAQLRSVVYMWAITTFKTISDTEHKNVII
jgi:hypothetical protein